MAKKQEYCNPHWQSPDYVYAIRLGDTPFVKLGYSWKPSERKKLIQYSLRVPLECKLISSCGVPYGRLYEQAIHVHFSQHRILGEWFAIPDDTSIFLVFTPEQLPHLLRYYVAQGAVRLKPYQYDVYDFPVQKESHP